MEFLFPYEWPGDQLNEALKTNDLEQVLFNTHPGNWDDGERGLASLPGREQEFRDSIGLAIEYATILKTPRLHCLAGIAPQDDAHLEIFVENLKFAARTCANHRLNVLIEPINLYDIPGYFLNTSTQALDIIKAVNENNLFLQYDIYHMHRVGDDMPKFISENIDQIAHFQIAGHPGRHEPDNGELAYSPVLETIDRSGFEGWIGCEYMPAGDTCAGLGWAQHLLTPPQVVS